MRTAVRKPTNLMLLLLGLGLAAVGVTVAAQDLWPWPQQPSKPAPDGEATPRVPVTQGDTVDDPFTLPAIPCIVTGNTCGFNHDYDYACPYDVVSTARDLVYEYVCGASMTVEIDLCESTYDTKVFVFEDVAYNVIACNDDWCAFQSQLLGVPFVAGHNYYIVIDGYSGADCGDYILEVEEHVPCVLECPPGAMPEGEPDCYDGYDDIYNSGWSGLSCWPEGCFVDLQPSSDPIVICGTTGVFNVGTRLYRDTDWFEINLTEPSNICLAGDAEVPCYFVIADGRNGCEGMDFVAYAFVGDCAPMSDLCYYCDTGTWWLWTAPTSWDLDFACGSIYWMQITGYTNGATPAEDTTWGRVKGLFR